MKWRGRMIGYMTASEALENGYTHHGKYYGIPVWVAPDKDFSVGAKWAPMDYAMMAAHYIEGAIRSIFYPHDAPVFQFVIGEEIVLK